jgi:deoxyribose-phosphate aldolase
MKIAQFLDATYLKTANEAGISEKENLERIVLLVEEAILHHYKLVMLRINYIQIVKDIVEGTGVLLGTVIDFPL